MEEDRRDTVVVEKDRSNPIGWIIGLIVLLVLIALFFNYGGFGMFSGNNTTAPAGGTLDADVNVQQPAAGQ